MGNRKRLILHIGTHKTGSSTIQDFLVKNALLLEEKFSIKYIDFLNFKYRDELMNADKVNSLLVQSLKSFLIENIEDNIETYLVSSEILSGNPNIYYSNRQNVANIINLAIQDFILVKIVLFVRRQDEFLQSIYIQNIQEGKNLSINHFIDFEKIKSLDWINFIQTYEAIFNKNKISIIPYDQKIFNSFSISELFCKNVGIDLNPSLFVKAENRNISFSTSALKIAEICNPYLNLEQTKLLRLSLQDVSNKGIFVEHNIIDRSLKERIIRHFHKSNNFLFQSYIEREYNIKSFSEPNFQIENTTNESELIKTLTLILVSIMENQIKLEAKIEANSNRFNNMIYKRLIKVCRYFRIK